MSKPEYKKVTLPTETAFLALMEVKKIKQKIKNFEKAKLGI